MFSSAEYLTLSVVVFAGFLPVIGLLSLRFIRGMPDFEHRPQMLWGAKWLSVVPLGAVATANLAMYFGLGRTPYPRTSFFIGLATFVFVTSLPHLRDQALGLRAAAIPIWSGGRPFDFDSWLARERRARAKERRYGLLMTGVAIVCAAVLIYYAVGAYPSERIWAEHRRTELLVESIGRDVASPLVEYVFRTPPYLASDPYEVVITLRKRASQAEAQALLGRWQQGFAALAEANRWRIEIQRRGERPMDREPLATGLYDAGIMRAG